MDLEFSQENLIKQLQIGKATIYTDKSIDLNLLNSLKNNIVEIIYEIKEDNSPSFCEQVSKLGIKCHLISNLPEDKINELKLQYMDIGNISKQYIFSKDSLPNHESLDVNNLYYRSKKIICKNDSMYLSEAALEKGIKSNSSFDVQKVIDTPSFWKNLDAFSILKK